MRTRVIVFLSLAVVAAFAAPASHISVSVSKIAVPTGDGDGLLYVMFADEAAVIDLTVSVYSLPGRRSSELGLAELRQLDPQDWWKQLQWTVTANGESHVIEPHSLELIRAATAPVVVNGTLQYRGTFRLRALAVGDYELEVSAAGVKGRDSFSVRGGDETPAIRDKYLERQAGRARAFEDFKRIQLERLQLMPHRADILLSLGTRALESGTAEETNDYYDRAVRVMSENAKQFAGSAPQNRRAEVQQRMAKTVANIRALQAELPAYFPRRAQLRVVEELVDGEMRFVIKDRKSGKPLRVIQPK